MTAETIVNPVTLESIASQLGLTPEQLELKIMQDLLASSTEGFTSFANLNSNEALILEALVDRWLDAKGQVRITREQLQTQNSATASKDSEGLGSYLAKFFFKIHDDVTPQDKALQNSEACVLSFEDTLEHSIKITQRLWPGTYQREVAFVAILKAFYIDVLQVLRDIDKETERMRLAHDLLSHIRLMTVRHFHYRDRPSYNQNLGDIEKIDLANWFSVLIEKIIDPKTNMTEFCEWYENLISKENSQINITNRKNDLPEALQIFTGELSKFTGKRV